MHSITNSLHFLLWLARLLTAMMMMMIAATVMTVMMVVILIILIIFVIIRILNQCLPMVEEVLVVSLHFAILNWRNDDCVDYYRF